MQKPELHAIPVVPAHYSNFMSEVQKKKNKNSRLTFACKSGHKMKSSLLSSKIHASRLNRTTRIYRARVVLEFWRVRSKTRLWRFTISNVFFFKRQHSVTVEFQLARTKMTPSVIQNGFFTRDKTPKRKFQSKSLFLKKKIIAFPSPGTVRWVVR